MVERLTGLRYRGLFLAILLFPLSLFAQDETRSGEEEGEKERYRIPDSLAKEPDPERVLLVPYEPNRYHSDLDKDMKRETGLRLQELRKRIRFGLDNEILYRLEDQGREVVSYLRENDPDQNFELKHVYRGLSYEYKPVPEADLENIVETEEEKEEKKGLFKKLFTKKDSAPSNAERDSGSGRDAMEEGQIKSEPDQRIRFMDARFRRMEILDYLSRKYGVGYLILINQLDLRTSKDSDPIELASGSHDNRIKVHYTILDHEGQKVNAGASYVHYPSSVRDLNGLIKEYFPKVADRILERLDGKGKGNDTDP